MSDNDMKLNVEVRTTSDDQSITKLTAKIKTLDDRIRSLGRTGTTKGLDAALKKNAKSIEKITKAFKPSEAMIGRIEKQLLDTAKAGKLTAAVIGQVTRQVNAYGKASAGLSGMSKEDIKAWSDKIVRAKAMTQAVQRIGEIQKKAAAELLEKQGELGDLHKAIHERNEKAAKSAMEKAAKAQNAAIRMGQTDQRLLLDKLGIERQLENDRERARENDRRHERFLDGGRRRREAQIARIERQARNRSNAGLDNRAGARNVVDQVQGQTARLSTRLGYRGAIEGNLGAKALAEYRDGAAKALRAYRSQMRDLRSIPLDQYDPKAETRVQKRLRAERQGLYSIFQEKMTFAREEQRVYDRNERDRLRAIREQERAYQRMKNDAFGGFNQFRSSGAQFMGAARQPAMAGAAVGAAGVAASLKGISSRMGVDTAETNLKIFGGESGKDFTQAEVVQARKKFLNKMAIDHGMSISGALDAFTEVRKTIGSENAEENTKNIIAGTTGLEMPLADTTKLLGMINRTTGNKMKPAQMKSVLNAIAVAAREDPTVAPEIVEGMKRGVGVMSMGNMSPEDLAAFVSGGQSAGIQPGKAGTFIAALGKDLSLGGAKGLDKHRKQMLNRAAQAFGFAGGGKGMARSFQTDSTGTLMKVFEKLQTMNPQQRFQSTFDLSNRMWDDEDLQFSQGFPGFKKTLGEVRDPKNSGFLDDARTKRMESWQGKWNQAKTIFGLFWESFGAGFDDIFNKVTKFFVDAGTAFDFDVVSRHVEGFLSGFVQGLGFKDINALLEKVFGKPGDQEFDFVNDLKAFGQGLASGLKSVFDSVKSLMGIFTGGSNDPEVIGRLTGKIIGLSTALIVLSPLITVLGAVVSFVTAIAGVARMVGGIAALAGAGGAGGAAAGTASAAAIGWPIVGTLIAGAFVGYLSKMGADWAKNKLGPGVTSDAIDMFIRPGGFMGWLAEKGSNLFSNPSAEKKGAAGKVLEDATKGVTPLQKAIEDNTKVQRQSYDQSQRIGDLIKPASFSQSSSSSDIQSMGARIQLAALSGGGALSAMGISRSGAGGASIAAAGLGAIAGSGGATALLGATPGQALPGTGFGRRGTIGGGTSSGMPDPGAGAGVGPYKPILDHIAQSEGTARAAGGGYNTSLGYGKFLPGGQEQNLTGKSLNEILALGNHMRQQPGNPNSSALGRYQIVGQTLRNQMRRLGLSGAEKFDEAMQDRIGAELVRGRGSNPTGLSQEWASLRGAKLARAVELAQGIPREASTTPGARDAATGVGSGAAGTAVDNAAKLLGAGSSQAASALGSKMTAGQWCADFVNGSLKSANIKGVNSSIANSFQTWGDQVTGEIKKGDVVVTHRGGGPGATGGHVGLSTGRTQIDERTGRLQYETISGNHAGRVRKGWENADSTMVRRAHEELAGKPGIYGKPQDIGDGMTSTGWKKAGAEDLAAESPAQKLARSAPRMSQGGGAGNGAKINAPIQILSNGDAQHTANQVQRRIQDVSGYHTQDRAYETI